MAERPINYSVPLSLTNVTSADLVVNNGNIETSGGADVVIGTIEGDAEAEFADPDRGVQKVKGASPSGDLRVDPSGNIYVNGYGDVTLEGPYREVGSVGGHNGDGGSIQTDSSGSLISERGGSNSKTVGPVTVNDGDTTTHTTESDITITFSECRWRGITVGESGTKENISNDPESGVTDENASGDGATKQLEDSIPDVPSGYEFDHHDFGMWWTDHDASQDVNVDGTIRIEDINDNTLASTTFSTVIDKTVNDNIDPTREELELHWEVGTNYETEIADWDIDNTDPVGVTIDMELHSRTTGTKTPDKTKDPSVSINGGAGSASFSGTLDDGVWSSWKTMGGMASGDNSFSHTIAGSQTADFEFYYEYDYDPLSITLFS